MNIIAGYTTPLTNRVAYDSMEFASSILLEAEPNQLVEVVLEWDYQENSPADYLDLLGYNVFTRYGTLGPTLKFGADNNAVWISMVAFEMGIESPPARFAVALREGTFYIVCARDQYQAVIDTLTALEHVEEWAGCWDPVAIPLYD